MSLKHYSAGQIRLPDSRGRMQLGKAYALRFADGAIELFLSLKRNIAFV